MKRNQTKQVARQLAQRLRANHGGVVLLTAPMGAGKTTLVAEVVKILDPTVQPCSPTFTLINQYNDYIFHADLYRLVTDPAVNNLDRAVADIGLYDLCVPGNYVFIEWAESLDIPDAWGVNIIVKENGDREFVITGQH